MEILVAAAAAAISVSGIAHIWKKRDAIGLAVLSAALAGIAGMLGTSGLALDPAYQNLMEHEEAQLRIILAVTAYLIGLVPGLFFVALMKRQR